jgi:hypothetical protein
VVIRIRNWSKFQHFKDRRPPWVKLHRELLDDREFNELSPIACKVLVMLWLIASESLDGTLTGDASKLAFRLRLPEKQVKAALDELLAVGFVVPGDEEDADEKAVSNAKAIAARNGFGSRHISDATKRHVWERDGGKCVYCGCTESIEYDHKHPVSKGGNSEPENIQLLCRPCNRKKRTKTAEQAATPAQPWLDIRTTETETEAEREEETEVDLFDSFYDSYPRKVGKDAARKAFAKRNVDAGLLDQMVEAIKRQGLRAKCDKGEAQYVPHPATWLNEGRWQDETPGDTAEWWLPAGFTDRFEAENARCSARNAHQFRDGKRIPETA